MSPHTRKICVFKGVAAAVKTGRFAVPHAQNTIIFGVRKQIGKLAAINSRCAQVFIHTRHELDLMFLHNPLIFLEQHINAAEG